MFWILCYSEFHLSAHNAHAGTSCRSWSWERNSNPEKHSSCSGWGKGEPSISIILLKTSSPCLVFVFSRTDWNPSMCTFIIFIFLVLSCIWWYFVWTVALTLLFFSVTLLDGNTSWSHGCSYVCIQEVGLFLTFHLFLVFLIKSPPSHHPCVSLSGLFCKKFWMKRINFEA